MTSEELNIILSKIKKKNTDFDILIETGSYIGETINNIKNLFKKVISIEITDKYYNFCKKKFINDKNVEIIKGDSINLLPIVIDKNNKKNMLFFLDGHYSSGDTGIGKVEVPLFEELMVIKNNTKNSLVIIDDADLFGYKDDKISWVDITESNILEVLGDSVVDYFYLPNLKPNNKKRMIIILK